jgi:uncharacterized DUF497 family protein
MRFAWDEAKRQSNLAKHGIDFVDAQTIFLGARFDRFARMVGYEERRLAIGPIHRGRLYGPGRCDSDYFGEKGPRQ